MFELIKGALNDLNGGLKRRAVWVALASEDVGDQHKRSVIGPIWLLLNYLAFIGIMIFIFGRGSGVPHFAVYVAWGFFVWSFLSESINDGMQVFFRQEAFIKGTVLPISVYIFRQSTRSAIRSSYSIIGAIGILFFSGVSPSLTWITILPALLLILATAPAFSIIFGILSCLLPELRYFVAAAMRIGMFVTPVFWSHDNTGGLRAALYFYNPFTHFLEIVREPLLTGQIPFLSWVVCVGVAVPLWLVALLVLGRFRKQIVFMI